MEITKLAINKKNKNLIDIFVDNQDYATIEAEIVFSLNLKPSMELSIDLIDKIQERNSVLLCYNKGLAILNKSMKTEKEIKNYLYSKGFKTSDIILAIDKYKNAKLIDDKNYAKKYIELNSNKKGILALKQALIIKGIDKGLIDECLTDINQRDTLKVLIQKYLKGKPKETTTYQKLVRHLLSKGFLLGEIKSAMGEFYDESWD